MSRRCSGRRERHSVARSCLSVGTRDSCASALQQPSDLKLSLQQKLVEHWNDEGSALPSQLRLPLEPIRLQAVMPTVSDGL